MTPDLPYKIACLCDLRDARGRMLLLHRLKARLKEPGRRWKWNAGSASTP